MDSRWAGPDSRGCSPLGIPSAQEGDDKAQTKPGLDAIKPATVYVHGRKGRKMSAWLQWLAEGDPIHPSIHPISPTVYSQTDIDKSGKYGSPPGVGKSRAGCGLLRLRVCSGITQRAKRLLQLRLLLSLFLQFWVVVGVSTGTQFMPARSGCSHARGRIRLTD